MSEPLGRASLGFLLAKASQRWNELLAERFAAAGFPEVRPAYGSLLVPLYEEDGLRPGELVWTGGDCHLYLNHLAQAELQLTREPLALPRLVIKRKPESLFDYRFEDFELLDYQAHGSIKAPIAV